MSHLLPLLEAGKHDMWEQPDVAISEQTSEPQIHDWNDNKSLLVDL